MQRSLDCPDLPPNSRPQVKGGFVARKVIPLDVRDEYAKLYRQHTEERLNTGPMPALLARAKYREWSSEIEGRIANIRAARKGEGRKLTTKEARALAGEWYEWFAAQEAASNWSADVGEDYQARVRFELYGPAMAGGVFSGDPLEFWERGAPYSCGCKAISRTRTPQLYCPNKCSNGLTG